MKTLEAHEQSLSKIFSDDYVFFIPGYQRPYSWTTEQASSPQLSSIKTPLKSWALINRSASSRARVAVKLLIRLV